MLARISPPPYPKLVLPVNADNCERPLINISFRHFLYTVAIFDLSYSPVSQHG